MSQNQRVLAGPTGKMLVPHPQRNRLFGLGLLHLALGLVGYLLDVSGRENDRGASHRTQTPASQHRHQADSSAAALGGTARADAQQLTVGGEHGRAERGCSDVERARLGHDGGNTPDRNGQRVVERLAQAGYHEASKKLIGALCEHLIGYARYSYDAKGNIFRPIITDGTDLTGYKLPIDGYFGPKGKEMEPVEADDYFLPVYALAYRLHDNSELWDTLRSLCRGNGLGDIGEKPGDKPALDYSTTAPYTRIVFTFVEIYRATGNGEYLDFAEHICKNILKLRYREESGLFTFDKNHLGCHLDCYEPLALLTVVAAKQGKLNLIPTWDAGGNYIWNHNLVVSGYSRIPRFAPAMGRFILR